MQNVRDSHSGGIRVSRRRSQRDGTHVWPPEKPAFLPRWATVYTASRGNVRRRPGRRERVRVSPAPAGSARSPLQPLLRAKVEPFGLPLELEEHCYVLIRLTVLFPGELLEVNPMAIIPLLSSRLIARDIRELTTGEGLVPVLVVKINAAPVPESGESSSFAVHQDGSAKRSDGAQVSGGHLHHWLGAPPSGKVFLLGGVIRREAGRCQLRGHSGPFFALGEEVLYWGDQRLECPWWLS